MGKRDVALLQVLGDCGLRSAELRGLLADSSRYGEDVSGRRHRLRYAFDRRFSTEPFPLTADICVGAD